MASEARWIADAGVERKTHKVLEYLSGSGSIAGEHRQLTFHVGTPVQTEEEPQSEMSPIHVLQTCCPTRFVTPALGLF